MKWIDSTDLRSWANKRDCQETLPLLVRKLIRATSKTIQSIKFPSGDSVLLGGWDGTLVVTDETDYLPAGISLWEFGTAKNPKGKADKDYAKRVSNPLGYNPAESTFIFVTPRLWQKGEDWVKEKKKGGIWKDIRVINSEILEEWIELAPTVGSWLAKKECIGKYPSEGIQPTDDFWEEWTSGTKFKLNAEVLLGGREIAKNRITAGFNKPDVYAIQGISREESLAFIISCAINNPEIEEDFFSRSIIVDNIEAFRELTVHDKPLILIPRFEDRGVANRAAQKGHTVIYPLGANSANNGANKISLPQIERESFVSALTKMGMTKEFAEKYSKESARDITILRRQLEFERTIPDWALAENISEIIPALIVGRWDENYKNDKRIIAKIAGESYENYSKKITRWLHTCDSPIIKIGSTWRLTSPFDAWTNASKNLTRNDFELLYKSVKEILSEINPVLQIEPKERHILSMFGKRREYSDWIREGVIQSLILTSILGDKLKFDLPLKAELWVDGIIAELLNTENPKMWKSFDGKLPLIAEASPTVFLETLEKLLGIEKSPIVSLFEEEQGFLSTNSYHTGLIWALESLAWFPQYLSRASLILAKLSALDPEENSSNRPINSLSEIFKPWHFQTLATFDERMQVLKLISERAPKIAWPLLIHMLPSLPGGFANDTHKSRWRMFEFETEKPRTYNEIYATHSAVVEILISIFDFTETKLAILIEKSVNLSPYDRDRLLSFIESVIPKIIQVKFIAWHIIRKILHNHRSYPEAKWALPESDLNRFEKIYEILIPTDYIANTIWMFNEHWPVFPEGNKFESGFYDKEEIFINDQRIKGLTNIYQKAGFEKIVELKNNIKEPWIFGDILGHIVSDEEEIIKLCELLKEKKSDTRFIQSFVLRKSILNNIEWIFSLFEKLKGLGFGNSALSKLFIPLKQTQQLWNFVDSTNEEIIRKYWQNISPNFYGIGTNEKIFGLKKLIEYKRFASATHICHHFVEEISSEMIVKILQKAGAEKSDEQIPLNSYKVNQLFKIIEKRNNVDLNILIQLEWLFLPLLASYSNNQKPQRLHYELSKNPVFFMDVLKWTYKPDDETKIEEQKNGLTDEKLQNRARHASDLLHSWKNIPGVDESGKIDNDFLREWIRKVRELAAENGRIKAADINIGKLLAQYPEEPDKVWPPDEICDLIETVNSEEIKINFSAATYSKRGSSIRGCFDGGDIERTNASYFQQLAKAHQNKFPSVTGIFEKLAKQYEEEAKRMDEDSERKRLEY